MNIFAVQEKNNKIIYLTKERWSHIIRSHSTVNIEDIRNTLEKPLLITKDKEEQDIRYYYKYFKTILSEEKYLMVVVKYLNGKGFIITSFYTDKIEGIK